MLARPVAFGFGGNIEILAGFARVPFNPAGVVPLLFPRKPVGFGIDVFVDSVDFVFVDSVDFVFVDSVDFDFVDSVVFCFFGEPEVADTVAV
jgi:hypothetical protein